VAASELLIRELYLDLRKTIHAWAAVTKQTSQARMGYVGQHLVSVVTGHPGGRSGARGYDLVYQDGAYGEVKTCYRVDQLGKCESCGVVVASTEGVCSGCGSANIKRQDDSKWLIGIRNDEEFRNLLEPRDYYFVLFEFEDLVKADAIVASIWSVDPRAPGFSLAMADYYYNIRANSKSKAPFNLWPYMLKFELMRPLLVYRSVISTGSIRTELFPGRDAPTSWPLSEPSKLARATGLELSVCREIAEALSLPPQPSMSKEALLEQIVTACKKKGMKTQEIADFIARKVYGPLVAKHRLRIPTPFANHLKALGL
jgi:hypothetical protein